MRRRVPVLLAVAAVLLAALPVAFGIAAFGVPFHRAYARTAAVFAFLWALAYIRREGPRAVGCALDRAALRRAAGGVFLGAGSAGGFVLAKWLAGTAVLAPEKDLALEAAKAILVGLAVAVPEEIFFRGYLVREAVRSFGRARGVLLASAIFSACHFLRPLPAMPFLALEAVGLFLVGWVLAEAYLSRGELALPAGIHAGWVFVLKFHRSVFDSPDTVLWGTARLVDAVWAWPFFLAVAAGVRWTTIKPRA